MNELFPEQQEMKGHFTIQCIDKNNKIIHEEVDPNLIMQSARTSVAHLITNNSDSNKIDKIILGTSGNINGDILAPKGAGDGFVNLRDRLFSESIDIGDVVVDLKFGDLFRYTGTTSATGILNNYYTYSAADATIDISTVDFTDTLLFSNIGSIPPYTYSVGFTSGSVNGSATNIIESDLGSSVLVETSGSSVKYTVDIDAQAANNNSTVIYTEAALYAGSRIFSAKTFKGKIKDASVLLRIIWVITF